MAQLSAKAFDVRVHAIGIRRSMLSVQCGDHGAERGTRALALAEAAAPVNAAAQLVSHNWRSGLTVRD
jgi:hypothetical protein